MAIAVNDSRSPELALLAPQPQETDSARGATSRQSLEDEAGAPEEAGDSAAHDAPPQLRPAIGPAEIDATPSAEPVVDQPPAPDTTPSLDALTQLTSLPPSCAAVGRMADWPRDWNRETRDPFTGRYAASKICQTMRACASTLPARFESSLGYLRQRPLLFAALRDGAGASSDMNMDAALTLFGAKLDQSVSDCSVMAVTLDRLVARNGSDPGHAGAPAALEFVSNAAEDLAHSLRAERDATKSEFAAWLPYAEHYQRNAELSAARLAFEQAFASPDIETLLAARRSFDVEFAAATAFKESVAQQSRQIAELAKRLNAIAPDVAAASGVEPAVLDLKAKLAAAGHAAGSEHIDVANDVAALESRVSTLERQTAAASESGATDADETVGIKRAAAGLPPVPPQQAGLGGASTLPAPKVSPAQTLLGGSLLTVAALGYGYFWLVKRRCPKCHSYFAVEVLQSDITNKRRQFRGYASATYNGHERVRQRRVTTEYISQQCLCRKCGTEFTRNLTASYES